MPTATECQPADATTAGGGWLGRLLWDSRRLWCGSAFRRGSDALLPDWARNSHSFSKSACAVICPHASISWRCPSSSVHDRAGPHLSPPLQGSWVRIDPWRRMVPL